MSLVKTDAIECRAEQVLRETNVQGAPIDVIKIAERLGVSVIAQPLEDAISGMLVVRNEHAAIGVNEDHHAHRQRFTIAHELGHYLLHRDTAKLFVDSTLTFYRDSSSADGVYQQEIEANAFAAALLMPAAVLEKALDGHEIDLYDERTVWKLATTFGVSQQALTIRLVKLGLVSA